MGVGPASINGKIKGAQTDGTSASVELGFGDITIGYEQNKPIQVRPARRYNQGAKYVMGHNSCIRKDGP